MLSPEKRAVESGEAAAIHRSAENAVLASLAHSASSALTRTLQWLAMWARASEEVSVTLNTDFMPKEMDANMFRELTNAYLTGAISYNTYFFKLKEGEVIREEVQEEEEQDRLETREPVLSEA
jgi:sugar/nucleoside kinase (ribokinase family)